MRRCRFQRRFSSAGHRAYSIFRSNTTSMKQNELQSTRQTSPRAVSTTKVASAGAATPYAWKLVALLSLGGCFGGVWSDQNPASGHGQRDTFLVKISDVHNPITPGLPETFEADDELYHNMHMSEGVHILATAYDDLKYEFPQQEKPANPATNRPHLDSNPTGKNEPMLWTLNYVRKRTVYTTLGHDVKAMGMPGFSTIFVRSVEWAATGAVQEPEPEFRSWAEPPAHQQ